jgi:gas vesicle protein
MKARIESGKIIKYPTLPNSFKSGGIVIENFSKASNDVLESYGFYDIVIPTYDSKTEYIHNLRTVDDYKDLEGNTKTVFTYDVSGKTFTESLDELKKNKIQQLKSLANQKLQPTDWYIIRKIEKGSSIPDNIQTQRNNIKSQVDTQEASINSKTNKLDVFNFEINL